MSHTVPNSTVPRKPVAYNATLFTAHVGQSGVALRDSTGAVFFQSESTGTWTRLLDADASRLQLHGRTDLTFAAAMSDGNLVVKCSRTLQRVAA